MAQPASDRTARWPLVLVLGALSAFGPLSIDMYLPALPDIGRSLAASDSSIQLTLTACTLGLGAGQLLMGPLSDVYGRRRPLLLGLVLFTVFSLGCSLAPNLAVLLVCRFGQALGGSAGLVISRAVARDLRSGRSLARLFSALLLVNGAAPVLAPVIGGQLVRITSWRGVFVVLALLGFALMVATASLIGESLPSTRRQPSGVATAFEAYRRLLGDRIFVLHVFTGGLGFATLFTYISASPFLLENVHRLSAQQFSLVFAVNSIGIIVLGLLVRIEPARATLVGVSVSATGAVATLVMILTAQGLTLLLPALFVAASGFGIISPNVSTLALDDHPQVAGAASALLGATQFLLGGLFAPLAGWGGSHTSDPIGIVMTSTALLALLTSVWAIRLHRRPPPRTQPGEHGNIVSGYGI